MHIVIVMLLSLYSCHSLNFQTTKPSSFVPNPYSTGWWVCAYCGKKYENGETSCTCH